MADAKPLLPGDPAVMGAYRLVGRLGAGGQGVVYLGEDSSGRQVAVKALRNDLEGDTRDRLRKEVTAAQRVAPFCTSQVLDVSLDGAVPYVVSEYVPGPTLREAVRDDGPRTGAALHRLAVGTATALAAIHEAGIVHRDFKPGNVLLSPDGPRVIDFGIARAMDTDSVATSTVVGTPSFMAPEQMHGENITPAADVFAWACVLVFAATGKPPFGQDTVPAVTARLMAGHYDLGDLPRSLRPLMEACLARDPAARPTARQVLLGLLGHAGVEMVEPAGALVEGKEMATGSAPLVPPAEPIRPAAQAGHATPPGAVSPHATPPPYGPSPPYGSPPPYAAPPPHVPHPAHGTPPPHVSPPYATPPPYAAASGYGQAAPPEGPPTYQVPASPYPARPRRSGRGCLYAVIGVVVLLLVILAALYVVQGSWSGGGASASPSPDPASPSREPSPRAAPISGRWFGDGVQTNTDSRWLVRLDMKRQGTSGVIRFPSMGCSGKMFRVGGTDERPRMGFTLGEDPRGTCIERGEFELERKAPKEPKKLGMTVFSDTGQQIATAELRHEPPIGPPAVPKAFDGHWAGTEKGESIEFWLRDGARGGVGRVTRGGCEGGVSPIESDPKRLELVVTFDARAGCDETGTYVLRPEGNDFLRFRHLDENGTEVASRLLTHPN